jgi:hypothetical protein
MVHMNELATALVAAGAALAGSAITGWFAMRAGWRQAAAAQHAGDRQADALLETVRLTLGEQRDVRLLDQRRSAYAALLQAAEQVAAAHRLPASGQTPDLGALHRALGVVFLEGPSEVTRTAAELVKVLERYQADSYSEWRTARGAFVNAAQQALH